MDSEYRVWVWAETKMDIRYRDQKALLSDPYEHAVRDRKRQREAHGECGPPAGGRFNVDSSTQGLHASLDDIHSHAASGNIGDVIDRGKTGLKNQVIDFRFRQVPAWTDEALR